MSIKSSPLEGFQKKCITSGVSCEQIAHYLLADIMYILYVQFSIHDTEHESSCENCVASLFSLANTTMHCYSWGTAQPRLYTWSGLEESLSDHPFIIYLHTWSVLISPLCPRNLMGCARGHRGLVLVLKRR